MSFLPRAVDGKKRALKTRRPGRDQAVDKPDDWLESENCFFDATCTSENEWNVDTTSRDDDAVPAARRSAPQGRIMVIGFSVIRV